MLDGVIGDTFAGIQLKRCRDGVRGASVQTTLTGAAAIFLRRVRREPCRGEDFGDKKPVAQFAANKVGMFSDESQTGSLGNVALKYWAGVDIPKALDGL